MVAKLLKTQKKTPQAMMGLRCLFMIIVLSPPLADARRTGARVLKLVEPLDVAEILTVWEKVVLWEHTYTGLVGACVVYFYVTLEGVEISLLLDELEWYYDVDETVA